MAGGLADVLDVAGADALLAGADRWRGGSCSPVNQGFMGAMPELMSSNDASFWGIREKLGRRRWPLVSKNRRNISRSSFSPKGLGSFMGIYLHMLIFILYFSQSWFRQNGCPAGSNITVHPGSY